MTKLNFSKHRNRAKKNSFTVMNLVFLLLKTTLDCVARIVLFSTWLYVQNEGQFSSMRTVIAYYSTFMVLLLLNSFFTRHEKNVTRRNMTGIQKLIFKLQFGKSSLRGHTELNKLSAELQSI